MKKMFILLALLTLCSCGAKAETAEEIRTANFAVETTTVENKEFEKEFKSYCKAVEYSDLTESQTAYKGSNLMFTGKVEQIAGQDGRAFGRIAVTKTSYGYDNIVIFFCDDDTIKKDDIITIYGTGEGFYTYKGALGQDVTKPSVKVMFVTNHGPEQN